MATDLGEYKLIKELGQGGSGTVYLAHHGDQKVAIKIAREEQHQEQLERESGTLQMIRHRHVVRHLDHGPSFLVTEFVEGETLLEYFCRGKSFSPTGALLLAAKVCEGLAAIHAAGFIHRDLKPENIFLGLEGLHLEPLILDLGLAQRVDENTPRRFILGTPGYLSPEQARIERLTTASDVYAIGCVLFVLLTKMELFPPGTEEAIERVTALEHPEEVLTSIREKDLHSLLMRLLAFDPAKRPTASRAAKELYALARRREPRDKSYYAPPLLAAACALLTGIAFLQPDEMHHTRPTPGTDASNEGSDRPSPSIERPAVPVPPPLAPRCPRRPTYSEGLLVGHGRVPDRSYWWDCQSRARRAELCARFARHGHAQDALARELCRTTP